MDRQRAAAILGALGIDVPSTLVDANGQPIRSETAPVAAGDTRAMCPNCQAPPARRRRSGGFGANVDLCGECGFAFNELTVLEIR